MLGLAGEIGDGVILTFVPPDLLARQIKIVRDAAYAAGRKSSDIKIVARIAAAAVNNSDQAREKFCDMLCFYLASPAYRKYFSSLSFADEVQQFEAAMASGDRAQMRQPISEAMISGLFITGDRSYLSETMEEMQRVGVDEVVINPLYELGDEVAKDTFVACSRLT